jgi:hypothetical protein
MQLRFVTCLLQLSYSNICFFDPDTFGIIVLLPSIEEAG